VSRSSAGVKQIGHRPPLKEGIVSAWQSSAMIDTDKRRNGSPRRALEALSHEILNKQPKEA
jgi:hypothetical protein